MPEKSPKKKSASGKSAGKKARPAASADKKKKKSPSKKSPKSGGSLASDISKLLVPLSLIAAKEGVQYLQNKKEKKSGTKKPRTSSPRRFAVGGSAPINAGAVVPLNASATRDLSLSDLTPLKGGGEMPGFDKAAGRALAKFDKLAAQLGGYYGLPGTAVKSNASKGKL